MSSAFSLGFSWFKDSCRTLKLQPLAYTGIVVFSLLMSGLLSSLPLIGTLLASLWMPFASVLTGFAARDVLAGRTPVYFTLIAIFRDKASRWPLLAVGILASIWMELDMLVFQMMGQADLAQWKSRLRASTLSPLPPTSPWALFSPPLPFICRFS